MNNKKFYAQINHGCRATTNGAIDIYRFLVLEFKNNKIYPSYLVIPSQQQSVKEPVNYKFENKVVYLAKPLEFEEDLGSVFTYINGNLISKKKHNESKFVFRPSLDHYFKRNK
ncbi:hypothetical protein [Chryseobacterium herbae]|uniref:Uncharacterized protein n=1 Tax=Chryseobacterium herbae TaxID=2976476 RepID=A0ABT2IZN8_9FLAO|nr:hypothetical protein [Chryseobacterium sp. pc1-10]MCT2564315.1 hypothetical protein [Chryseobacterium sp. pc1-10]